MPGSGARDGRGRRGEPRAGEGWPAWRWWLLTGGGLALAWLGFHSWKQPNFILIPIEQNLPLAPLYAFYMPSASPFGILAVLVLAAGIWGWRRIGGGDPRIALLFLLVFAFAFRLAVHAGREGELPGAELGIPHGEEVIYDVPRIESASAFLRSYTALQPELSLHGRTKPPGYALLLYGLIRLFGSGWTTLGTLLTLLGSAIVVPAFFLRGPGGDEGPGRQAALMVAALPAAVLYGAVTLDALFAVVAGIATMLAMREAFRPRVAQQVVLGLVLSAAMMLSYSAFVLIVFVLLLLGWRRWREPRVLAVQVGLALAAFLVPFVLLFVATGFNAWECFQVARSLNTESMNVATGRDVGSLEVWAYTSMGNILAFLIFLGVPLVAGLLRFPWRRARQEELALAVAFVGALGIASFGGLYLMETGRIFLFLTPAAAALAVRSPGFSPGAALGWLGVQAILFEVVMFTIW